MLNKLLEKYIPSKYYLNYLKENNISCSDYQVAAILSHCIKDPFKLNEELSFIYDNTNDEKLKEEIEIKINDDNRLYDIFKDNSDRQAVYVVYTKDEDDEYDNYGYFYHFDLAFQKALESKKEFKIEKQKIQDDNPQKQIIQGVWNPHYFDDVIDKYESDDYQECLGTISYDTNGDIEYFYVKDISKETDEEIIKEAYKDNFENVYMHLEHPFEIGDIVKDINLNKVGIVELSKQEYDEFSKKVKDGFYADDFDSGSVVSYLCDDGHFFHEHPLPFFLEKYEPDKNDDEYDLLTCASYLLKHQCSLDFFISAYEKYRNKYK